MSRVACCSRRERRKSKAAHERAAGGSERRWRRAQMARYFKWAPIAINYDRVRLWVDNRSLLLPNPPPLTRTHARPQPATAHRRRTRLRPLCAWLGASEPPHPTFPARLIIDQWTSLASSVPTGAYTFDSATGIYDIQAPPPTPPLRRPRLTRSGPPPRFPPFLFSSPPPPSARGPSEKLGARGAGT